MVTRLEILDRIKKLEGLVERICSELETKKAGVVNLRADRRHLITSALEKGSRADTERVTRDIALLGAKVGGLEVEAEVARNLLSNAAAELEPYQSRDRLVELIQRWEGLVYECRGLANRRQDWGGRKEACMLALERDNAGLAALLLAGIAGEADLRRHTDQTDYNDITWSSVPFGMYPEVLVLARSLAAEMGKEGVVETKIPAVPGNEIARALDESHGDHHTRLTRYKRFQDDYAPELGPDEVAEEKWAGIKISFE